MPASICCAHGVGRGAARTSRGGPISSDIRRAVSTAFWPATAGARRLKNENDATGVEGVPVAPVSSVQPAPRHGASCRELDPVRTTPSPQRLPLPQHDIPQAQRFLTALDPLAREFCFQAIHDQRSRTLARTMHGSLNELTPTLTQ